MVFPVILLNLNYFFVFGWPKQLKGNASMFCFILFFFLFFFEELFDISCLNDSPSLMYAVYIGVLFALNMPVAVCCTKTSCDPI